MREFLPILNTKLTKKYYVSVVNIILTILRPPALAAVAPFGWLHGLEKGAEP